MNHPGTFTLSLDYACDDAAAGNAFRIHLDGSTIRGSIGGTGAWSSYRSLFVSEVALAAGEHRLAMYPAGPIRMALADVRTIALTPRTDGVGSSRNTPKRSGARPHATTEVDLRSPSTSADSLARRILDDARPVAERVAIIQGHPELATDLVAAMVHAAQDSEEEYRRIPWIWRAAIATGRRNDPAEIKPLLAFALRRPASPSPIGERSSSAAGSSTGSRRRATGPEGGSNRSSRAIRTSAADGGAPSSSRP